MSLMNASDKVFWHHYVAFYEKFFAGRTIEKIAEIGVFRGNSIRWLLERFPQAIIHGADILPVQPEWPVDLRFNFTRLDQGDLPALRQFFTGADFDLIIEDGSHVPEHQALALLEGIPALRSGGLYLLEDIHTSHPAHPGSGGRRGNALTILLGIDHCIRNGLPFDAQRIRLLASGSLLDETQVRALAGCIESVELYRRTRLPDYCYRCGANDFDYSLLKCRCGVDVFADADSMTIAIVKK